MFQLLTHHGPLVRPFLCGRHIVSLGETLCLMAAAITPQVSNAVQGARDEIISQAAGQSQTAGGLGESGEYVLDDVLGWVHTAGKHHSDLQQITMVLIIGPPQGCATAAPQFPDKQLIFHYLITHQEGLFLYMD